jgi:hypothetical protein
MDAFTEDLRTTVEAEADDVDDVSNSKSEWPYGNKFMVTGYC